MEKKLCPRSVTSISSSLALSFNFNSDLNFIGFRHAIIFFVSCRGHRKHFWRALGFLSRHAWCGVRDAIAWQELKLNFSIFAPVWVMRSIILILSRVNVNPEFVYRFTYFPFTQFQFYHHQWELFFDKLTGGVCARYSVIKRFQIKSEKDKKR